MGTLANLQNRIGLLSKRLKHNTDPKITMLFLLEELGETARALLKEKGHKQDNDRVVESSAQELGDVLYLVLYLAYLEQIDLEDVLERTVVKLEKRSAKST